MFNNGSRKKPASEYGQGLVEYALIIVLVAVVTIIVVSLLGEQVQSVFCDIVLSLGDSAPSIEACEAPRVTCLGVANGQTVTSPIVMEAEVKDNNGPESIRRVEFYVDGARRVTEYHYRYCLGRGDDPCGAYPAHQLSSGSHTIEAVAYDADGYTGTCSVTINVP